MANPFTLRSMTPSLGAEVLGCNLDTIDAEGLSAVAQAIYHHGVIVLRDQRVAPDSQVRLAEFLGPIEIPVVAEFLLPEQRKILILSNIIENGRPIGATDAGRWWHVDMSYQALPGRCTLLHAIQIPRDANGRSLGDTMFANCAAAYDALSFDMKSRIAGLSAVHSHAWRYAQVVTESGGKRRPLSEEERQKNPDVLHPIVRPHPKTGRNCLYVNEGYSMRIADMDEVESTQLLRELFDHATQPQFVYRHRWQPYDLVIWDNCLVQHRATGGYDAAQPRRMHRIVVKDTAPQQRASA